MSRWTCMMCSKSLSSKRSYMEHLNTHNDRRPFTCDQCDYAAASQMTLRRHKLRNHVPRSYWGYSCPHCVEIFMEPASYQTHVSSWHPGRSATFGCNFCQFSTKSSKHFRDHIAKHFHVVARHSGSPRVDSFAINVVEYLIDDENGRGYSPDFPSEGIQPGDDSKDPLVMDAEYLKTPLELRTARNPPADRRPKQPTAVRRRADAPTGRSQTRGRRSDAFDPAEVKMETGECNSMDFDQQFPGELEYSGGSWVQHEVVVVGDDRNALPPLRSDFQDIDLD